MERSKEIMRFATSSKQALDLCECVGVESRFVHETLGCQN